MWSVVILSPTFSVTAPRIASGRGALSGGFPMFGPRRTSTVAAFRRGGEDHRVVDVELLRHLHLGVRDPQLRRHVPRVGHLALEGARRRRLGGDEEDPGVLRSGPSSKFRLFVRTETPPEGGACPAPMQKPQAVSRIRAPAPTSVADAALLRRHLEHLAEPAATPNDTPG